MQENISQIHPDTEEAQVSKLPQFIKRRIASCNINEGFYISATQIQSSWSAIKGQPGHVFTNFLLGHLANPGYDAGVDHNE